MKKNIKDKLEWFVIDLILFGILAAALAAPELICKALGVM